MLEIVDPQRNGLAISDGAEVGRHFDAVLVRLIDGGSELRARNRGVRFEPRYAFLAPVAHRSPGVVRSGERMHPANHLPGALEVRSGDDHFGADRLSTLNVLPKVDLLIRVDAAGGSNRGDT